MQKINKRNSSEIVLLAMGLLLVIFVAVFNTSLAWFTDEEDIEGTGTIAIVDAQLVDANGTEITSTESEYQMSLTYTGASTYNSIINLTTTGSTVNCVARAIIILEWPDSLMYQPGITYTSTDTWVKDSGEYFLYYVYYNAIIEPNSSVNFITDFIFPELGVEYYGNVDITIQMEVLQATTSAVADAWGTTPASWTAI